MRYEPFERTFFEKNRERLRAQLLPSSLAIINANDIQPTTTDGNMPYYPNSDLFYFTGVEQEESILVIAPALRSPLPLQASQTSPAASQAGIRRRQRS
jgi:Xaa-Pro aminopeptidase